jgi:methylated-DNA-protein-cysteine methyltransferase-like protein
VVSEESRRIEEVLRSIPRGRVTTYGAVAERAGLRNGARQVVRLLHARAEKEGLPWFRVLRRDGSIALEGEGRALQADLLRAEGVEVDAGGKVDLGRYDWK